MRGVRRPMRSAPSWFPSLKKLLIWQLSHRWPREDSTCPTSHSSIEVVLRLLLWSPAQFFLTGGTGIYSPPSPNQAETGCQSCPQPGHPETIRCQGLDWPIPALQSPEDAEGGMQVYKPMKTILRHPLFSPSLQSGAQRSLNRSFRLSLLSPNTHTDIENKTESCQMGGDLEGWVKKRWMY